MFAGGSSRVTKQAGYFLPLVAVQNRRLLSDGCEVWVRKGKGRGVIVGRGRTTSEVESELENRCLPDVCTPFKIFADIRDITF
jgi:hypothetical protein